ncbi:MAG: PTS glucose transporter subunit IIA [Erysipelotrichaceae bacterium]|nr:PTS glucose transporter subunit IIA [Erysipelotrichaceae bacterium]
MAKKYEALAKDIVKLVGGNENIVSMHHCQTRIRFKLKDDNKADTQAITDLDGVSQVLNKGGMYQVVVGMQVAEIYEEVEKLVDLKEDGKSEEGKEKQKAFDVVSDFVSSIFSPIVPALAGAGMVKALLALLTAFNLVDKSSQTYILINMIGDATFAFMPILLGYTTAQKLKCNPILAAVTAGIMCHATWTGLVSAGEPVKFLGLIPLYLVRYTGSVIPIVLVILVQAPVEKWLNKVIPASVRLVFVPMITFIVMGILALSVLGPLGDYVGKIFTAIFTWLSGNVGWLETGLMGGLYSTLVIFGLHHGLAPLGTMQMAQMGYDGIFGPGVLCANIGQGTASLITGLLSKDSKTRQIGTSAGITGLMGTTEPALYGINVPKKYPLIAGAIGAACGGLFAGLTHTHRYATGSSGLPAVVMYIGEGTLKYFYNICIALLITIVITAILTVIFFRKYEKEDKNEEVVEVKGEEFEMPVKGEVLPMSASKDEAFSSEAMGKGAVVEPSEGVVRAPFDGEVLVAFPTGHAIGLKSNNGTELLIHIGIDTVEMNGDGFELKVRQGDKIRKGQELVKFDHKKIEAAGHPTQTMIVVTNTASYESVELKDNKITVK